MFTVQFTTRRERTIYGPAREVILHETTDVAVTIHGLPGSTAMSYSRCDNFVLTKEISEPDRKRGSTFKRAADTAIAIRTQRGHTPNPRIVERKKSFLEEAARSGDMAAALNAKE